MKLLYVGFLGLLLCLAGPALAHFELIPPLYGLGIFVAGGLPGIVAVLWGCVAFVRRRERVAMLSLTLGLLPVLAIAIPAAGSRDYPRINDISTDLESPPELANGADYPPEFIPQVRQHYSDITPLAVNADPARTVAAALELARSRDGWEVTQVGDWELRGTATSSLFRFRDDITIRVRPVDGELGAMVDMRSRSRDGKGDLGVNARRIRAFLTDLQSVLARR